MILGALAMLVANAATLLGAHALLERIKSGSPSLDVVLFLLLRFLLISATVWIAGLIHALNPWALGLAGAGVIAVLYVRGAHRQLPRPAPLPWSPWLAGIAGILALRLLLQAWIFAPYTEDALSYHLPKIAEWIRAGGFTRELGGDFRSSFPAGFELLETWWALLLRHDALIELAGIEFLALAAASVYALSRELGGSTNAALAAALLTILTPGLHLQATSALNDGPTAAMILTTAALIVGRAAPALVLVSVGLGAGIKPTYLFPLPGLALLFWLSRREGFRRPPTRWTGPVLAGTALLIGAAWYFRNLLWFGNPAHPMGSVRLENLQQFGPSLKSLEENLSVLINLRVYDVLSAPGPLGSGNANWGAVAFACGFPALIALVREDVRLRRLAFAFGVSLLCILTSVVLDPWNSRFILFLPALPALALAHMGSRSRVIAGLTVVAALFEVFATNVPAELPLSKVVALAKMDWKERSIRPVPDPVRRETAIGFYGDNGGSADLLYGPDYARRVVYLRDASLPSLLATLDKEGLRYFYLAQKSESERPMFQDGLKAGVLRAFSDGMGTGFERVR